MLIEESSSDSNTQAVPEVTSNSALAIPAGIFAPARLQTTCGKEESNDEAIILVVVVLPLVPHTTTVCLPKRHALCARKFLSMPSATLPGS